MARNNPVAIQQYRGTTAQHAAYTGPVGELTVDTDKNVVVVQDGVTAGGHPMASAATTVTGEGRLQVNAGANGTLGSAITIGIDTAGLATDLISVDANNGLVAGTDGKLYVGTIGADLLIRNTDLILHSVDGKVAADLSLAYNTTTGKLDILGHDGATVVSSVTVPSSVSMLQSVELVAEDPTQPGVAGPFFHFVFLKADSTTQDLYVNANELEDVYTGEQGITVEGTVIKANYPQFVSAEAGNALRVGQGGAESAVDGLFVNTVSTDADNLVTKGTDNGVMLTQAAITDAVKAIMADAACGLISDTAGNQLMCDNGLLMVQSDYGTM